MRYVTSLLPKKIILTTPLAGGEHDFQIFSLLKLHSFDAEVQQRKTSLLCIILWVKVKTTSTRGHTGTHRTLGRFLNINQTIGAVCNFL